MTNPSIWDPASDSVPAVRPQTFLVEETIYATEGQTDFTIQQFTYVPNTGTLRVYVNGIRVTGVRELTGSTFGLPVGASCKLGDKIFVEALLEEVSASQVMFTRTDFTAIEGQTEFVVVTVPGKSFVILNGAQLSYLNDYTETGTKIVLAEACVSGDFIEVYAFDTIKVADMVAQADLASSDPAKGAAMVSYNNVGIHRTVHAKLKDTVTVKDSATPQEAWDALSDGGVLDWPYSTSYPISSTLNFTGKGRVRVRFNGQLIDASSMTSPKNAVYFKKVSQSDVDGLFVIGNKTNVTAGVHFDADAGNITIHQHVGKVHVSGCDTGIIVGNNSGYQYSDSVIDDLYGADCNVGVKLTGENTLAMMYGRIAAYNNSQIGVHFEQGGGSVTSLQVAASGSDLYFGQVDGANHNKLNRWDIASGYSEEGVAGERFINSAKCSDTNPFNEEIVISGFRVTPFTSTNVPDFLLWQLNGDLTLRNCTITHGQQLPVIAVDHNLSYRAPKVTIDGGVIEANPKTSPQVVMTYTLTSPKQVVEINSRVNNGISHWNHDGLANEGVIKSGIYMRKLKIFEQSLLNIYGLTGAWNLRDLPSGTCNNLALGAPSLSLSAAMERRDFWLDDGLIGFYRNSTTSKTLSTTSSVYSKSACTFGCILRTSIGGVDETSETRLGGTGGVRLGIGDTGGAFLRCQVAGYNAQATPTNPLDPHLIIGRYDPGVSVKVNAINLRTGEIVSATTASPALVDVTWSNGVSIRNDLCVRGFPFVYNRSITDPETYQLLQSAMLLTDSWK